MRKKKKTVNFIKVGLPLYRVSVAVFFGVSLDGIIKEGVRGGIDSKKFTEEWKKWPSEQISGTSCTGFTMEYGEGNKDVLVWIRKKPQKLSEYAVLYHELYHATDHIADSRDFYTGDKISEPRAYIFEYLFMEVSKVLW